MAEENVIIGIDLGTSTTEAAVIRDGEKVMITNFNHEVITPSAVGIDKEGNWVIGERAKEQYLLSPQNTAIEIKRKTGSGEKIRLGKQSFSVVELSSKLLSYVRTYVSENMQCEINRAVISVPAYFDEIQRQETVLAAEIAGFQVERIINEPTAAALSYGLDHMDEESHILVYDLGGGTFDVTLLEMFGGVLEVKASNGDNHLGGKDFDEALVDLLDERFLKKHKISLKGDAFAMAKLKAEAELCKKELSSHSTYHVQIPMLAEKGGKPLALDEVVTLEEFEKIGRELLSRTHESIDIVLADSGLLSKDIDKIILVGGSTRMPMVSRDIEEYMGIKPEEAVDPDFAVAEGAAIQAGIIEGSIKPEDSIIMTDVNPFNLGVRAANGFADNLMSVIIPRNTTIPVTKSEMYCTGMDGQSEAIVAVYQGESDIVESNHFLGDFVIGNIPFARAGEEKIQVSFSYNLNGMLEVEAEIMSTGKKADIEINLMDQEADVSQTKSIDLETWREAEHARQFRTIIRRAEKILHKLEEEKLDPGDERFDLMLELEDELDYLKECIILEDVKEAKESEKCLLELLEEV